LIPIKDNLPTDHFPVVTAVIIAINVAVFLFLQGPSLSGDQVKTKPVVEYGAVPYKVTHPGKDCDLARVGRAVSTPLGTAVDVQERLVCEGTPEYAEAQQQDQLVNIDEAPPLLTLFTSMFMHGGWLHIIFNMLFLWIFGNNIEDSMGKDRFAAFYLLGGAAALAAQTAIDPNAAVPTVGASGAIAAVLGGYALLYPRARVVTVIFLFIFFTFVELPALVVLGLWFLLQLLYGAADLTQPVGQGGGVAYFAHIGGFVFGLVAIKLFANRVHEDYEARHRIPVY
jgi:membrane associated rhomboid family serine protease